MLIESKPDEVARELLGHAIGGELDEYAAIVRDLGEREYLDASDVCTRVAGYIAVDICGQEWPSQVDLLRIAQIMARADMKFTLDETEVYDYLALSALGFESLLDVFPDMAKAGTIPFFVTAALLVAYHPEGMHWWEYLDVIEKALAEATPLAPETLPAVVLQARQARAMKES
jgi:hypothetical protein